MPTSEPSLPTRTCRSCCTTSRSGPGARSTTSTLIALGNDVSNIVGVKDAAADPGQTAFVVEATPPDFEVYSGDDPMTLPLLAVGAVGAIGVATHWCSPDHVQMFDAWDAGDAAGAAAHNARQLESYAFETSDAVPNPLPAKAMLRALGHAVGQARLPMGTRARGCLDDQAPKVYDRLVASSWLTRYICFNDRTGSTRRRPSASCSSADSARSVATAWSSSRVRPTTPTAR